MTEYERKSKLTEEEQAQYDRDIKYMNDTLNTILDEQFNLVYYGKGFNVSDIESMSIPDRKWYYHKLERTIKEEREQEEQAQKEALGNG